MKVPHSQKQKKQKKLPENKGGKGLQDFAKYSGLAFQMIAIILVMTWVGIKLDKYFNLETPVFTVIFSLLGVFAGIYNSIRDFLK